MVSVFYSPSYHQMIISNGMLKLCTMPNEQIASQSSNLQMATSSALHKCDSNNNCKHWMFTRQSTRYLCNQSQVFEDLMTEPWKCPNRNCLGLNETLPMLMRNQTAFARLSPNIVLRQGIQNESKFSHRNFSIETDRVPLNRQMKDLPKTEPSVKQISVKTPKKLLSRNYTWTMLSQIYLKECMQNFLGLVQYVTNLILDIEPIQHLTCAFSFFSAIFEYFSIRITYVLRHQVMPGIRRFVERIFQRLADLSECLEHSRVPDGSLGNEVDTTQKSIFFIRTTTCQNCLKMYPGQYPSLADALPPKPFMPQQSRERLLPDCSFRQLLVQKIIKVIPTTHVK